jgi:Fe-S cluster assembly protein SufD
MSASENTGRFIAAFNERRRLAKDGAPAWLEELRQAGMKSFAQLGFPTTRNEEWKHTNVEPAVSLPFGRANGEGKNFRSEDILARAFVETDAPRLVFLNGVYAPELSSATGLPAGASLVSLAELNTRNDRSWAEQIGRYADLRRNAFVALNSAFLSDGAVVIIPPGCRLARPIYLVYASGASERPLVSYPRTLILLGADSEARIVESYAGVDGGKYFCNAVTELVGGAASIAHHCRLQNEGEAAFHMGTLTAHVGNGAHLSANAVTLGGALVRNNVHVTLDGEGAECVLNGLYIGDGKQHIDNFTEIEHAKPRATSLELYKGILAGAARGVFNGKIIVHKDAQKSDARQTNRNLLLSADAVVNTQPQLEIYADDVKCSHGSTIGQLDGDALFYLRSRGLGPAEARSLLSFAFASDIVGRLKIESLRRRLDDYLVQRFRKI